jgi:hypothetical protein
MPYLSKARMHANWEPRKEQARNTLGIIFDRLASPIALSFLPICAPNG